MNTTPPQVLSAYFAAVNERRLDDAAACFAPDARVHDENHDHVGTDAIRQWIEETTHKYQPKAEVTHVAATADAGAFIATATVSGTFPGSPVQLGYTFTVAGEKITHLSIQ
ncbi:MAG: nuclear transport factor 2 family protein [Verrucomicrobia bacterium]|nr:nuclear transport factor 2 family protein [Verrucomicrobiota bacterium]